ncbi:hypothetical protein phiCTP1_gp72 [Clostridium phage phiCTP1]|uniref:hypothetical protein n=1 Tax=Clostridium phage phiCTP1 TaxID=871584 RepID=UPI0001E07859|nr:hypothetical protein phiCTP1_gp72 [Clostridium phage phiCTP1]ADL40373.1 hypothetical phage protein [Clostridium phage phiCTP1]
MEVFKMKKERMDLTVRMMEEALIFNGVVCDEVNTDALDPAVINNYYVNIDSCSIITLATAVDKWAKRIINECE